jgi:hypothetical protein
MVEGISHLDETEDYAGGSVATGRAALAEKAAMDEARLRVYHCRFRGSKVPTSPPDLPCLRQAANLSGGHDIFLEKKKKSQILFRHIWVDSKWTEKYSKISSL